MRLWFYKGFTMDFVLLNEQQKEFYSKEILRLMTLSDKDFIPPLSARSSTLQKNLVGECATGDVKPYYSEMIKQQVLGFIEDGVFLGFVSFKLDYTNDTISEDTLPNVYLSTLVLAEEARGKKITFRAYDYIFNTLYPKRSIYTRTWSTNIPHLKILDKFNFSELKRIKNDRGDGIDTVYFELKR